MSILALSTLAGIKQLDVQSDWLSYIGVLISVMG